MQGVLYVSHGTRLPEGKQEAIEFLQSIQPSIDVPLQEICFLEIIEPTIEDGIKKLVEQGATAISIVPILLLSAAHAHDDIPSAVEKVKQSYPTVTFTYGQPLGIQDRIIDVLEDRLKEQFSEVPTDVSFLVVGRGSRDEQTMIDIKTVAKKLGDRINSGVDVSFLAVMKPSFEEALGNAKERGITKLIVLPYLWFNGLLIRDMTKKIDQLNQEGMEITLCGQLGDHDMMKQALIDRVNESFDIPFTYQA